MNKFSLFIVALLEVACAVSDSEEHTQFFEDGSVMVTFELKNDSRNGEFKEFFPNGSIKKHGSYIHDSLHGILVEFDVDGDTLFLKKFNMNTLYLDVAYKKEVGIKREVDFLHNSVTIYKGDSILSKNDIK